MSSIQALQPYELTSDLHSHLREREATIYKYESRSPHVLLRPAVVKWIQQLCQHFRYAPVTRDTAVFFYDKFTDQINVPREALELVALVSIHMAGKVQEREEDLPSYRRLLQQVHFRFTAAEMKTTESVMLKHFEWDLTTVTPAAYMDLYAQMSLSPFDTCNGFPITEPLDLARHITRVADEISASSTQNTAVLRFAPSVRAAAAVIAARATSRIGPMWSSSLLTMCDLSAESVQACLHIIMPSVFVAGGSEPSSSPTTAQAAFEAFMQPNGAESGSASPTLKPSSPSHQESQHPVHAANVSYC